MWWSKIMSCGDIWYKMQKCFEYFWKNCTYLGEIYIWCGENLSQKCCLWRKRQISCRARNYNLTRQVNIRGGFWAVSFEKRLATRLLIHIIVIGQGAGGFRTKVKVENEYEKLKNTLSNYRCFLEDFFHINTKYKKKHHELYKKRMEEAEIKKLKNLAAMLSFKENLCNFCCGWKSK